MNLRHIVPALGLMALTAAPALAAESTVSFEGWVDTILSFDSNDVEDDDPATEKDEEAATLRFTAQASLKANWKVTDALTARTNLWFDPDNNTVTMREGYFAWALNDSLTWSMGKYINHVGWIAAEPTGLYTVNASHIGYTSTYGNDVLGTSLAFAPKDSPISGSFHITNGYFSLIDAYSNFFGAPVGTSDNRENTDLGFGLDVTYNLPNEMGNINAELVYDMHSDVQNGLGNDLGGDVLLFGLNATVKVAKPLLIGAEFQYMSVDDSDPTGNDAIDRMQFMLLANYAIEGASIPMSVTGMIQYVSITDDAFSAAPEDTETRLGVSVALLTNPLTSSNFGLNFEVGYWDVSDFYITDDIVDSGSVFGPDTDATGFVLSVEGLVTF